MTRESLGDGVAEENELRIWMFFDLSFEVIECLPPCATPTSAAAVF